MGNNPSKGPAGDVPSTSGHSTHAGSAGDRKVTRRPSLNAPSGTAKATAADPSASKETATGHPVSQNQASVQQRLQSRNAPDSATRHAPDTKKADPHYKEIPSPDSSNPVQVPTSRTSARHDHYTSVAPSGPPHNAYYSASAHLQRPPRLPLPIGDATATPGSPYMGSPPSERLLDEQAGQGDPKLGDAAVEDEEVLEELEPYTSSGVGRPVPTIIEWTAPGDKVYVTGTFVNWEKKFRLHRSSESNPGVMSTRLNLRPGTHHLKFIVDGEMRAADSLPTAVDFTNHLVNYIEISADDTNRSRSGSDKTSQSNVPPGVHPPQVLPTRVGSEQVGSGSAVEDQPDEWEEIPQGDFRRIIPQFLVDLDREDETQESPAYQQAVNVIGDAPTPPSLPLFLGKSILNGTTPMKDDSSVLNYPNHTVLNHLATSSIKNGVLATSATTRYKRKYVTTILYKPTGDIAG
ncbi:snf1 kinase complex beta-subunit Gal83 [Aspergillus flavus AF70]|nr:snf1 kinase complex beta-subunit Gal83 [Aspergillus flavus AF70]